MGPAGSTQGITPITPINSKHQDKRGVDLGRTGRQTVKKQQLPNDYRNSNRYAILATTHTEPQQQQKNSEIATIARPIAAASSTKQGVRISRKQPRLHTYARHHPIRIPDKNKVRLPKRSCLKNSPTFISRTEDQIFSFRTLLPQGKKPPTYSGANDNRYELFTINQVESSTNGGILFHTQVSIAGKRATCLIDCGATNDFISSEFVHRNKLTKELAPTRRRIRGYDGTIAPAGGVLIATLQLTDTNNEIIKGKNSERQFLMTTLHGEDAILGLPWLSDNNPRIDFRNRTIIIDKQQLNITIAQQPQKANATVEGIIKLLEQEDEREGNNIIMQFLRSTNTKVDKSTPNKQEAEVKNRLLKEFKDVFPDALPPGLPPSRGHELKIKLRPGSTPPARTAPRMNYKHRSFESKWIKDMLQKKLIRVSQSEYAAPHFYVDKPETPTTGEYRAVTDFRALNEITIRNKYPLPRADELFDKLAKAKYFSKIDLRTGFYQILIAEEDRHKTAFTTSQGLFEYNVLPMGLCNSPAIFMQLMNDTFREYLDKWVLVFLDDIIVYSQTLEEHEQHLRLVLKRLRDQRLYVKLSKSEFCKGEVEFLGHYVGREGIRVMEDKIQAIRDWPRPKNMKELRSFLGLAGYYRRFVKGYSSIALPISDLVRNTPTGKFMDSWGSSQELAFMELKQTLQATPVLILPDPTLPFVVDCDASGYAIGAVLQQDRGKGLQPIAYMSKKMLAAETRYPVHEQELLAIISALTTWRHHLEGTDIPVRIRTDHKSLIHFQQQPMLSGRQTRWLEILSRYNYIIEYMRGIENTAADALSRRIDHNDGLVPLEREPVFVDNKGTFEQINKIMTTEDRSILTEIKAVATESRQQTMIRNELRQKAKEWATKVIPEGTLSLPNANRYGSRITPTQRCTANNSRGEQCGAKTAKGQYCHNHMRIHEGVRVTTSTIPKAHLGLFAARDFKKGEHVADYTGDQLILRRDQAGGPYVLQLTQKEAIDAARTNTGYGRWANDPSGSRQRANAEFVINNRNKTGRLRTTRAVKKGQELFVSYGPDYWRAFGKEAKAVVRPAVRVNTVDAQSDTNKPLTVLTTSFSSELVNQFEEACKKDEWYENAIKDPKQFKARMGLRGLVIREGRIFLGERLWVPNNLSLQTKLITECHDTPVGGHLGRDKTIELMSRNFYWDNMNKVIEQYVLTCEACQRNKSSQQKTAGELMPIPSPEYAGHTWTMDLITGLPKSRNGNDAIVVWVCKLSKLRHYAACKTSIDAPTLARLFMNTIVRQHGLPKCIISDRDPRFTANFWKAFWTGLGTSLNMSTASHAQTDGQTENANKVLEIMLRSRVDFDQTDWDEHLAAAELAINNARNETTGYSPFYLFYGRNATLPLDLALTQLTAARNNPTAQEELARWRKALTFAKENTQQAQKRQARYANRCRRREEYRVDDRVLLSTSYLKLKGESHRARKLTERYIGPYRVKKIINRNAYELELPPTLRIHPVINISYLKRYRDGAESFPDRPINITRPPPVVVDDSGAPEFEVDKILDHRYIGRTKRIQYLVSWKGYPIHEATWEPIENLDGALDSIIEYNTRRNVKLNTMVLTNIATTLQQSRWNGA